MMAEIDDAARKGLISPMAQYQEIVEHLPYYAACVRETLRLNPSAPNLFLDMFPNRVSIFMASSRPQARRSRLTHGSSTAIRRCLALMRMCSTRALAGRGACQAHEQVYVYFWLRDASMFGEGYCHDGAVQGSFAGLYLPIPNLTISQIHSLSDSLGYSSSANFKLHSIAGKPSAHFVIKGGVGFWRDMWVTVEKRGGVKAM